MLYVVESFSGIGAQAKALERLGIEHEILSTIEWDINAIMAYDIIHNGRQDLSPYMDLNKEMLTERLSSFTLSANGKDPFSEKALNRLKVDVKRRLLCAIERCGNLGSITDVHGNDIPENIDLFTYSFPCQDLSIAGFWHGNLTGIDRDANNRSGMLWEVERILIERYANGQSMPRFLLMENVSNIEAPRHSGNFEEWKNYLESIGYINHVMKLNAKYFGIPQNRERVYMLSVFCDNDEAKVEAVKEYLRSNDLNNVEKSINYNLPYFIRTDYNNVIYLSEANEAQPNDTPSRRKIYENNTLLFDGEKYINDVIKTITTKQDRNPNSGVISYLKNQKQKKAPYRNLTPRECFLLMGFDETDFQSLIDNNFKVAKNR